MNRSLAIVSLSLVCAIVTSVIAEFPTARLQQLQLDADRCFKANDRTGAAEVAAKIIAACDAGVDSERVDTADHFDKDDQERITFLLLAAKIDLGIGNSERAIESLNKIVVDAQSESPERLQAEAFLLKFRIARGEEFLADAIELLAKTSQLSDDNRTFRDECQDMVIDGVIATHGMKAITHDQLATEITAIEQQMIDAGIAIGVARLCRFAVAVFLSRNGGDEMLEESLDELKNIVAGKEVTAYRKAQYWNLTAGLQLKRRHFADAFDACREFEINAKRAGRIYEAAIARDQSALVTLLIGDYAEARKAFESTRPIHTDTTASGSEAERIFRLENATWWRFNLAKSMEGDNEFLPARSLFVEASQKLNPDRQLLPKLAAIVDNELGLNHYLTGDFETAAAMIIAAKESLQKTDKNDEAFGATLVNEAWIAFGQNNLVAAESRFREATDFFEANLSREHPRYAEALTYLARIKAANGELESARLDIELAEQLVYDRIHHELSVSRSAQDRIAILQESRVHPESVAWPGTVDTYLELAPSLAIQNAKQYDVVLRWKNLLARFNRSQVENAAQLIVREREINARLREAYFRKVSLLKRRELQREIDELEAQLRQIQRIARPSEEVSIASPNVTDKDIAAGLQTGDLFIDIFQIRTFREPTKNSMVGSGSQYVAFVLQPSGAIERLTYGPTPTLDAAIIRWTELITSRKGTIPSADLSGYANRLNDAARQVANIVQRPILDLDTKFDRVLIRPDGATHLIPWSALPGVDGKRFWVENVSVQISNSAELIEQLPASTGKPSLLAVGGVDFGDSKFYSPLPGTLTEKRRVVERFETTFGSKQVVELEGREATEAAILQSLPNSDYIHLATHGFYHRRDARDVFGVTSATTLLQTGLVVAVPTKEQPNHDQYLTAAEIGELDLSNTSLVVLSACESSLGQTLAGQGVQGMLDSFHNAGATTVIGTLWVVDDAATVKFIDQFYDQLWNHELPPANALRAAQLAMIQTSLTEPQAELFSQPYAWAAFICSRR